MMEKLGVPQTHCALKDMIKVALNSETNGCHSEKEIQFLGSRRRPRRPYLFQRIPPDFQEVCCRRIGK